MSTRASQPTFPDLQPKPHSRSAPLEPDQERGGLKWLIPHESALQDWASRLAPALIPGLCLALEGPLGAGKTTLVRALLRALGIQGLIRSPTYTLLEIYSISSLYLYHFDFYRIKTPEELEEAGFREYFCATGICFVEWASNAGPWLPWPDLHIELTLQEQGRALWLIPHTPQGRRCLERGFINS